MAKGIYVGVSSKARKVTKAYIGVDNKARKVKKGYIGVNGVAKLFYSAETLIVFSSNPIPTNWTAVTNYTKYTANNDYGTWTLESTIQPTNNSASFAIYKAFDGNESTSCTVSYSSSGELGSDYFYLTLPSGVLVKPKTFVIKTANNSPSSYIQIYDSKNDSWVNVSYIDKNTTKTYTYAGDIYTNKIRIWINASSYPSSYTLYDFKLTEGTFKIE